MRALCRAFTLTCPPPVEAVAEHHVEARPAARGWPRIGARAAGVRKYHRWEESKHETVAIPLRADGAVQRPSKISSTDRPTTGFGAIPSRRRRSRTCPRSAPASRAAARDRSRASRPAQPAAIHGINRLRGSSPPCVLPAPAVIGAHDDQRRVGEADCASARSTRERTVHALGARATSSPSPNLRVPDRVEPGRCTKHLRAARDPALGGLDERIGEHAPRGMNDGRAPQAQHERLALASRHRGRPAVCDLEQRRPVGRGLVGRAQVSVVQPMPCCSGGTLVSMDVRRAA